jgi:integrase
MPTVGVRVREQVTCPEAKCRYQQAGENEKCKKCERTLKGVKRKWYVFVAHAGKRKAKCVGNEAAARDVARKIEAKLSLGDLGILEDKPVVPTIEEVGKKWLDYIRSIRRETTAERYQNALDLHILPRFGDRPIDSIKRPEIKDFLVQKVNDGYAKGSVALMKDILSGVFTHAWDAELIESNPVTGIWKRLNIEKDDDAEVGALTPEEANLFLETCEEHYREHFPFFQTAIYTGLRLGELLGAKCRAPDIPSGARRFLCR